MMAEVMARGSSTLLVPGCNNNIKPTTPFLGEPIRLSGIQLFFRSLIALQDCLHFTFSGNFQLLHGAVLSIFM
jgi:hypothetical protein